MRLKSLLAALAAIACIGLAAPGPAAAFGDRAPDERVQHINHRVYYPRYVHQYQVDPYAYRYSPRGYYPYYNSGYWKPAHVIRKRNHLHYYHWNTRPPRFDYYASWGGPKKRWHHHKWHHQHHGRHYRWHW